MYVIVASRQYMCPWRVALHQALRRECRNLEPQALASFGFLWTFASKAFGPGVQISDTTVIFPALERLAAPPLALPLSGNTNQKSRRFRSDAVSSTDSKHAVLLVPFNVDRLTRDAKMIVPALNVPTVRTLRLLGILHILFPDVHDLPTPEYGPPHSETRVLVSSSASISCPLHPSPEGRVL